jgi:hypothetical protein
MTWRYLIGALTLGYASAVDPTDYRVCARESPPQFAKYFEIEKSGNFEIARSLHEDCKAAGPWQYVLWQADGPETEASAKAAFPQDGTYNYFEVPITKVALMQTVANSYVETIDQRPSVKLCSTYSSSACLEKMVEDGDAKGIVSMWSKPEDHMNQLVETDLDLIITSSESIVGYQSESNIAAYEQFKDKVVCDASSEEDSPNARAEWIKWFGAFYGEYSEQRAIYSYCATTARYACNSIVANIAPAQPSAGDTTRPQRQTLMLWPGEMDYTEPDNDGIDEWYVGIFDTQRIRRFMHAAAAKHPDMSEYEPYLNPAGGGWRFNVSIPEELAAFHTAISSADVLVDPHSWPFGFNTAQLRDRYKLAPTDLVPAFETGRVFGVDGTLGGDDGTAWFESAYVEPDLVLADIICAAHPEIPSSENCYDNLHYLRHVATRTPVKITADMCTDVTAPRPILAPTCTGLADAYLSDEILNWISNLEPADPDDPDDDDDSSDDPSDDPSDPGPEEDDDDESTDMDKGVIAAIAVLATLSLGLAVALGIVVYRRAETRASARKSADHKPTAEYA